MLVLSRKSSETIVINGEITIHVLRIRGGSIRIGIEAPRTMPVRRGELRELSALIGFADSGEPPEEQFPTAASA